MVSQFQGLSGALGMGSLQGAGFGPSWMQDPQEGVQTACSQLGLQVCLVLTMGQTDGPAAGRAGRDVGDKGLVWDLPQGWAQGRRGASLPLNISKAPQSKAPKSFPPGPPELSPFIHNCFLIAFCQLQRDGSGSSGRQQLARG